MSDWGADPEWMARHRPTAEQLARVEDLGRSMEQPLGDLARRIYRWSRGQGFYDEGQVRPFDGQLALVHSEVSKALEHWRDGHEPDELFFTRREPVVSEPAASIEATRRFHPVGHADALDEGWKPDGVPIELADVLIRVLDIMAHHGLDPDELVELKMAYNLTRSHRNGGKRS